jgi:hypothetical protein
VGAVFCQRVFWQKWRNAVEERRLVKREEDAARSLLDEEKPLQQREDINSDGSGDEIEEATTVVSGFGEEEIDREKFHTAILLRTRHVFKVRRYDILCSM